MQKKKELGQNSLNIKSKKSLVVILFVYIFLLEVIIPAQTQSAGFDIENPITWHLDWNKLKNNLLSNADDINIIWAQILPQERQKVVENLIKSKYGEIEVKGFDSSRELIQSVYEPNLRFTKNGLLTNGKAFLDIEKLPEDLKGIEYSEKEKAFIYEFKDKSVLTIRTGILNRDLTITGTSWPSDGIKWNKNGEFKQTSEGVEIKKNARVELKSKSGTLIVEANKGKEGFVNFMRGETGNKRIKGKNIELFAKDSEGKDFAKISIPDKKTEVFFGNVGGNEQYVRLAENGKEIMVVGEGIQIEIFKDLEKIEVDGDKISVKNKELFYEFKNDKEGKPQTYISHKPGEGKNIRVINKRNLDGEVLTETSQDGKSGKTENTKVSSRNERVNNNNNNNNLVIPNQESRGPENPLQSGVRLRVDYGRYLNYGSGTFIGYDKEGNGIIITVAHAFEDSRKGGIYVETYAGKRIPAELIHVQKSRDLALVKIRKDYIPNNFKPTPVSRKQARVGSSVLRVGCPGGGDFKQTPCIITNKIFDEGRTTETTTSARQGESGGGLFYGRKLVGVLFGAESYYGGPRGEAYYASTSSIQDYLREREYGYLIRISVILLE